MADTGDTVTACVIIIGNEILSGRIADRNLPFLATALNEVGVIVREARVVPDVHAEIADAINQARRRFTYVFTTGGIGPTHDDITAEAVAQAFGLPVELHPEAVALLQGHYRSTGAELNDARLRMARLPAGATLVENPVSRAPGFRVENVFVLAGVPSIAEAMFHSLKHELVGGAPIRSRAVAVHLAEGTLAAGLGALQDGYPDVDIGSYPYYRNGRFGTSIVCRGTDVGRLEACTEAVRGLMRDNGGEPIEETISPG